jgi:hypothetical protein
MSPPPDLYYIDLIFNIIENNCHFFNQGADIKFISGLVNKKPRFHSVNRLKKLKIAKPTLSCESKKKETHYVVALW